MKKFYLTAALALSILGADASVVLDGTEYATDSIYRREVGPGIVHTRYRIPDYPLNVYTIEMDLNHKYNRIETSLPQNLVGKNETLANAYNRHKAEGKYPIAGANASFWVVPGHGEFWQFMLGTNFGGCVMNEKIITETNMHNNIAYGGKGIISVDKDKKLWFDAMSWYGEVKSPKWDKGLQIIQYNKICNNGELAIFTSDFGRDRKILTNDDSENIFLTVDEGQSWAVNQDMTATVKAVKHNSQAGTVGEYDFCITGNGAYIPYLSQLEPGDKIKINQGWTILDTKIKPAVDQLLEGNVLIMKNGEVTAENDTDSYCKMVYSRCGYGASQDGKRLFIIVIDMSTSKHGYGHSKGCPSRIMSQILKQMGCWNAVNMDAGGSAQMMVDGSVVNTTTESNPRAVSTCWLVYSTAPRSQNIARIEFDDVSLKMPVRSTYSPRIVAYNEYDDIVTDNLQGVTFSCDNSLATCNGSVIKASGKEGYGSVTATYNGISVSKPLTTTTAPITLRIKPQIMIDGSREYPIEVISEMNRRTYIYDPADMEWIVEDPTVASIENGILRGLKNGTTKVTCKFGDFQDETTVKVEIATAPALNAIWSNWTLAGTGTSNRTIDADGNLSFTYKKSRTSNIRMENKTPMLYGVPDRLIMEFTSPIPVKSIRADLRSASHTSANLITFTNNEADFEANKKYVIDFGLSNLCDLADLKNFPISLNNLTITLPTTGVTDGNYTIQIHRLEAQYDAYSSVNLIENNSDKKVMLYPNPVTDGTATVASQADAVAIDITTLSGSLVKHSVVRTMGGASNIDLSDLAPGIYVVRAVADDVITTTKIIVK